MNSTVAAFYLKVQRIEQVCLFELCWGTGQQLSVTLPYPETLTQLYQEWQQIYLCFYNKALRGRVQAAGKLTQPKADWHAKLVQAEAKLLYEFHRWLRHEELYEIRATIAKATSDQIGLKSSHPHLNQKLDIDVFLTVDPIDLSRLPWEAWELGTEFAATSKIRIIRKPKNIRTSTPHPKQQYFRNKVRVLVILGDDTGLNFKADKEAVRSLSSLAEIQFVGWQPGENALSVKAQVVKAIQDEKGWDILLFAGHSNETELTGGELGIAPNVCLSLSEIIQPLTLAINRGLQFALFNSCQGLSLANALIDLGLNQVAIMREPIHNQVAQEFLLRFIRSLTEYHDVHDALLSACQFLKLEKHLTYPSAYLIPSLFRHPNAPPFQLKPLGLKQRLKPWLPTQKEAIALTTLLLMSFQLPIQQFLLERRVYVQSIYRNVTQQFPKQSSPPVVLVLIDEESILQAKISNPRPMDRSYLAQIIDRLTQLNAKVIGIDYLLDRYQPKNDKILAKSLQNSVKNNGTWFIFASDRKATGGWFDVLPELADPNWSLNGDLTTFGYPPSYMALLRNPNARQQRLPLGYLLALSYKINFELMEKVPQPQLNSSIDWLSQLKAYLIDTTGKDYQNLFSSKARLQPITQRGYRFKQFWFHPIIDFSIPPQQVYQSLPAWQLLDASALSVKLSDPFVVLIAPGGYGEAGIGSEGQDNFPLPMALEYWMTQYPRDLGRVFPGGEAHAYVTHHFIRQRFVVPIPDFLIILLAAFLGKGTILILSKSPQKKIKYVLLLISITGIYGLVSLQLYISSELLFPWVLPSLMFWVYILIKFLERKFYG